MSISAWDDGITDAFGYAQSPDAKHSPATSVTAPRSSGASHPASAADMACAYGALLDKLPQSIGITQ